MSSEMQFNIRLGYSWKYAPVASQLIDLDRLIDLCIGQVVIPMIDCIDRVVDNADDHLEQENDFAMAIHSVGHQ
jgi:hypothetical protein